jgi:hypothetical protein
MLRLATETSGKNPLRWMLAHAGERRDPHPARAAEAARLEERLKLPRKP